MLRDIWTITSKEVAEYFGLFLEEGNTAPNLLMLIGLGLLVPLQLGDFGVESGMSFVSIVWLPFYYASNIVVDSFAGERERHTLETLLATRIPEYSVLLGKILATVIYSFTFTMGCYLLSLIVINFMQLFNANSNWIFPSLFLITFSLMVALFFSTLGVLICLRSPTVRQASQRLHFWTFIATLPLLVVPIFINFLPSEIVASAVNLFYGRYLFTAGVVILFAMEIGWIIIFYWAARRFKRKHLLLD